MRFYVVAFVLCIRSVAQAQPPAETYESSRWNDPELAFGASLLVGGYAGALLWAGQSDGDQDALWIPIFGPWAELFTLPDCVNRETFCSHADGTRGVLILDGAIQLIGTGFTLHALLKEREKPVLIAPAMVGGAAGFTIRGGF